MTREGKSCYLFPMQSTGSVLKALRERAGLTAREAASRARISESYLSRVESGKANPTDAWFGAVAASLSDAMLEKALSSTPLATKADALAAGKRTAA